MIVECCNKGDDTYSHRGYSYIEVGVNHKGILDRGPIILITRQANNQSLNSAQNQGDHESSDEVGVDDCEDEALSRMSDLF